MGTENQETQTFEQKVTSIVSSATVDQEGNLVLPEGLELDEPTKYAVTAEKRRRDTQSAYSRAQQEIKTLKSENSAAWEILAKEVSVELTTEEKTELEELKTVDLDKWRLRLNELDGKRNSKVEETRTKVKDKSARDTELEARVELIKQYNEANPDHTLTDDVIENDIPPRYLKDLEKGTITFEQFIEKSSTFLKKGKVIAKGEQPDEDEVDLSKANGSSKIPKDALDKSNKADYNKETY